MLKLIRELGQNFNVGGKELLILEHLIEHKTVSAKEISRQTRIPQGRIYDYLNELIDLKLLQRSEKKPYYYSIQNFNENILEFLRYQFDAMVRKQHRIMNLLEHKTRQPDEIDIVESGDDFSFRTVQLLGECRFIKNIVRHGSVPFTLYPERSLDFVRVRNIIVASRPTLSHTSPEMTFMLHKAHNEAYKKGKKMEYVVEEHAANFHFTLIKKKLGSKFGRKVYQEIRNRLQQHNVSIHVIKEYSPMQTLITDKKVFLSIIHLGHTQGVIIRNDATVSFYREYFEDIKKRAKDIRLYMR